MKTIDHVLQYVDDLVSEETQEHLTSLEEGILKGAWERKNYTQISNELHCSESHIKKLAANLWKKLSHLLGSDLNKDNLQSVLERRYRASQRDNFGYCVQINEGSIHFGKDNDNKVDISKFTKLEFKPMSYSEFKTIAQVQEKFGLTVKESENLFEDIQPLAISEYLQQTLKRNLSIANAINTEKARSELLIAPILLEIRQIFDQKVGFFSGTEFNVDVEAGLNGFCDFLLTASSEIYEISCPVITLVEAKNENIKGGLGQCIAEMVAAQRFNARTENSLPIYGVVTTGIIWKFLRLEEKTIWIDQEDYFIKEIGKLLGILSSPFQSYFSDFQINQ